MVILTLVASAATVATTATVAGITGGWAATGILLTVSELLAVIKGVKSNSICQFFYHLVEDLLTKKEITMATLEESFMETTINDFKTLQTLPTSTAASATEFASASSTPNLLMPYAPSDSDDEK